jgi:2-amino-4-hydroxy-6-hydroxymethyldihydropteridine diphosphokinase
MNWAPVHRVFVSMGSNIDPERNLPEAVRRLAARCRLLSVSPVYETRPVGPTGAASLEKATAAVASGQPSFLNAAVLVETRLTPAELKSQVLQAIELELGRVRTGDKYAPRTIDLDISLFDDEILELGERRIPDPEILQFPHIARPLADLAPGHCHPETGQTLRRIAEGLPDGGLVPRPDVSFESTSSLQIEPDP